MALSTRHRSSIYRSLAPILGEEEADAMLNEFPAAEADELVTKGDLRAGLAEVRTEVAEVRTEVAEVRTEIAGLRSEMSDRLRQQTVWTAGALFAGCGLAAGLAQAFG
jgi:hypothetical protein